MKERKHFMDWAKFFGLYPIVLGHYIPNWTYSPIATYLYTFHVPLFFIVSGYFAKEKTGIKDSKKIATTLIVPYILLVLLGYALDMLFCGINAHNILQRGFLMVIGDPVGLVNPMWFVYTLLMVRFIWIIECDIEKKLGVHGGLCILFILILCVNSLFHFDLIPSFVGRILIAYPLFFVGYLMSRFKLIDIINPYFFICLILLPLLATRINGVVDIYSFKVGKSVLLFYIFAITTSFGWICLFKSILNINSGLINTIVTGSLIIVAFHKFFLRLIFNSLDESLLFQLIIPLLVIAILYYPIKWIQKNVPILIGKRKV